MKNTALQQIKNNIIHHKKEANQINWRDNYHWLTFHRWKIAEHQNQLLNLLNIWNDITSISSTDLEHISKKTKTEKNLEYKLAETLLQNIQKNDCISFKYDWDIIWFISGTQHIYHDQKIIEVGSARIDNSRRGLWLWSTITWNYLQHKQEEYITLLTKTEAMHRISWNNYLQKHSDKDIIWTHLGKTLEDTWSLSWYTIYMNTKLKELFDVLK